jgi:hypothetical protein
MKTKALSFAVAFASSVVVSSMAQSNSFSPNVVGFVKVPTVGLARFTLICNPLNNTLNNANNNITNLFPPSFAQDGDLVYRWNATIQDLDATVPIYSAFSKSWTPDFVLKPGEGVFYLNAGVNRTNTFMGEVIQGLYTNPIPFGAVAILGGASFNALGSSIPLGGSYTNAIVGITPNDGDQVFFWNTALQDFDPTSPVYSSFSHLWTPAFHVLDPGIGFFYLGTGPNQARWVRSFTVQ